MGLWAMVSLSALRFVSPTKIRRQNEGGSLAMN